MNISAPSRKVITISIVVAALGYFVDIYDLILFGIVREASLKDLGLSGAALTNEGVFLLNMQMLGMLAGGILWGVFGDRKGRISVLFGSILMYSVANILNGFVQSVETYAILRVIAGIGLAGELGAGITLVSEIMPKETRGYGTTIVATVGILGAVVAALVGDFFDWRIAYFVGGGMGIALLLLRIGVYESHMFQQLSEKAAVSRGNFFMLFTNKHRFLTYLCCTFVGLPIWYMVAILVIFSPELGRAMGMEDPVNAGQAVMYCYIGLAVGDLISGYLSQILKSRKKVLLSFQLLTLLLVMLYLYGGPFSLTMFYTLCFALGFAGGYWAVFVTVASEQFGTNIRATVTTTVPNFVRGSVFFVTTGFQALKNPAGTIGSAAIMGLITLFIAFASLAYLKETFGKDLDYYEV